MEQEKYKISKKKGVNIELISQHYKYKNRSNLAQNEEDNVMMIDYQKVQKYHWIDKNHQRQPQMQINKRLLRIDF